MLHSRSIGALCGITLISLLLIAAGCTSPDSSPPPAKQATFEDSAVHADTTARSARVPTDGERSLEQRLSDLSLAARIKQALARDRALRGYDFEPEVEGQKVLLKGDVQTRDEHERAAKVATRIASVEAVTNAVTVVGQPVVAENNSGPRTNDRAGSTHVVQPGETLWDIARSHRSSVDRLQQHNNLSNESLKPGQELNIPEL